MDPLYLSTADCPCCEHIFQITKVRPSFKKPATFDSDYCGYYKNDINPDFYVIRICPLCGYSFSENMVKVLSDTQRKLYMDEVGRHWKSEYFHGERTLEQALISYKRALMIAQLMKEKGSIIAGFLHHIAWLYRYKQDEVNEQRFMKFALDQYIIVYETEDNNTKNAKLMFMIGELNKRIGEYQEAVRWFSKVINDQKIVDATIIRQCREQWKAIGEILAEQRAQDKSSTKEA